MFWKNADRRIEAISVFIAQATKPGISNIAKSSYLRAANLLMYTIIEGAVYQIVKKHTDPGNIIDTKIEHKELYKIPKTVFSTPEDIAICSKTKVNVCIDDNVSFGKFNIYLKNNKLINQKQYKTLEAVRKERNKLHLQSLKSDDTGYTIAKLRSASRCLQFLLPKI